MKRALIGASQEVSAAVGNLITRQILLPAWTLNRPSFPTQDMATKKKLSDPILIVIGGTVVPKERPRVEGSHAHFSENYTQWQKSAKLALQASIAALPATVTQHFPLSKVRVEIEFHGCIRGNGDLDNSEGSWLDAMVKAGILSGDNVTKVNEIGSKFFERDRPVSAIVIYPNWTPISVINPTLLEAPNNPKTVKLLKTQKAKLTIVKSPTK